MTNRRPGVPRSDLKPGISLCFAKAHDQFEGALALLDAGKPDPAANLYVLGVQEVGKAKLLREASDAGGASVRIDAFTDHDVKVEKGATVLGSSAMWLRRGVFDPAIFDPRVFDVGTPADEPTRLDVLYVSYGSTGWLNAPSINAEHLRENVQSSLAILPAREAELLA